MKRNMKKVVATALAMTMCVPVAASAADVNGGAFTTSFDIYSPTLTVEVPVNLDIEVNPFADTTATDTKKFEVASKSMDIINGSVDKENDLGIPVVATIKAKITSKSEGVITEYNTFTSDKTSAKKRIQLNLSKAGTAATIDVKAAEGSNPAGAPAYSTDGKLDLSQYAVKAKANYTGSTDTAITGFGSLLSIDIGVPTTKDTTNNSYANAADVVPTAGSFAVTGVANTGADWKKDDIGVEVTYSIKASSALNIATPTLTGVTYSSTGTADLEINLTGIGEAEVIAMAAHNDNGYGDAIWESTQFKFEPDTTTAGNAKVTISKDDSILAALAGDDYNGKAQDFVVVLSDGRYIVSTLTVN